MRHVTRHVTSRHASRHVTRRVLAAPWCVSGCALTQRCTVRLVSAEVNGQVLHRHLKAAAHVKVKTTELKRDACRVNPASGVSEFWPKLDFGTCWKTGQKSSQSFLAVTQAGGAPCTTILTSLRHRRLVHPLHQIASH